MRLVETFNWIYAMLHKVYSSRSVRRLIQYVPSCVVGISGSSRENEHSQVEIVSPPTVGGRLGLSRIRNHNISCYFPIGAEVERSPTPT